MAYVYLIVAIILEVIGTTLLKISDGFTQIWATLGALTCYGLAFFFLSLLLRTIPIGIAYAVWAGLGIVIITLIGIFAFGEKLDLAAYIGIALIVAGVVVLNVLSNTTAH